SSVSSEPKRKRKRSSECSETLTTNGISSLRLGSLKSEPGDFGIDGSGSENLDSPDPLTTPATPDPENSYQCLKWLPFKPDECCIMYDDASQRIPPPLFRVDADKGFNYSFADEAFVCQKKNHLQVTAYMSLQSEQAPKYVRGEQNELRRIEKFCLHLYGIKMESQASRIGVEQSQADRSKRHYEPLHQIYKIFIFSWVKCLKIKRNNLNETTDKEVSFLKMGTSQNFVTDSNKFQDVYADSQGLLHIHKFFYSETTANNMRKKGKPNPDQRYFLLVVAVYAHSKNKEYLVCANVSERIIVRVDTSEQLKNVSKMKLYRYRYSREYLEHAGLGT
ncbi:unnamed protein product, partial [Porites evermanni]